MQEWQKNGKSKVIHPKYYKHGLFALAEKVQFKAKIDSFHTSMFIIFLVRRLQCTEVRFASFLSGGFITVNSPERKLEKHTSVKCTKDLILYMFYT